MRIAIDLDGTICDIRKPGEKYADVKPKPGAVEKLKKFKQQGHYIIITTARHMKTAEGNVNFVVSRLGLETLEWLEKHEIPHDEVNFGKPYAQVYIDDRAIKFEGWDKIQESSLEPFDNPDQ